MTSKLVLFDCDGTILDSQGIIQDSMVRTFAEAGYRLPKLAETRSIIGLTLDLAIATLLGRQVDDEVAAMTARYKQHFHEIYAQPDFTQSLFDGMGELVRALQLRNDVVLGMVTGKSQRGVTMFLDRFDFHGHFKAIRTADDCPSKPHPAMVLECCAETGFAPKDALVIGDSVFDMQMAKSAGATAVGVAWGYNPPGQLLSAGADHIAGSAQELARILEF